MSYRFLGQNRSLRGYGGSLPVVVHCLYDTNGQAVQSLYYRDPSRYGGSGNNVCYKDNSFTEPPRVRPPTQSTLTCVTDLYGRTIYDIYGMSVCYVPKVATASSSVAVLNPQPVTSSAPPSEQDAATAAAIVRSITAPEVLAAQEAEAAAVKAALDMSAASSSTFSADTPTSISTPSSEGQAAMDLLTQQMEQAKALQDALRQEAERAAAAANGDGKDNKALIVGGIALLAVIGGVVYYKMRKG